jgi:hypothetical protein
MLVYIKVAKSEFGKFWWGHRENLGKLYEPTKSSAQTFHKKGESATPMWYSSPITWNV